MMTSMRGMRWGHEACLGAFALVVSLSIAAPAAASPAPARSDNDLSPADSPAAAPPAVPPATPAPAPDAETPRQGPGLAPRIHVPPPEEETVPSWFRHPGTGLTFELGFFLGGADLASAVDTNGNTVGTIGLGSGLLFSIGGIVTPLWIGDSAGFGVGAFAGVKYDSLSAKNGGVSLTRFPLGAALHLLIHVDDRWWLFFRGGLQKEYGIDISGSGDLAGSGAPVGSLGGFGEGGVYWIPRASEDHTALVVTFRYGRAHDSGGGMTYDASSGGIILALHYNFI